MISPVERGPEAIPEAGGPQLLWLQSHLPSTNELLKMQRSAGFYAGVGTMEFGPKARTAPARSYAAKVREIRDYANLQARARRLRPVETRVRLYFWLLGCDRFDPSAWYLSAKAIEDGLCDAKVIPSDRFNVWGTAGRCVRGDGRAILHKRGIVWKARRAPAGMLVELAEVFHEG